MSPHAGPTADPLTRLLAGAALAISLIALFVSLGSSSTAAPPLKAKKTVKLPKNASLTPRPYGIQRLTKAKKFPSKVIPKVAAARTADTLSGAKRADLVLNCPGDTADLGTWCLQTSTYTVPNDQIGKNDFAYAARRASSSSPRSTTTSRPRRSTSAPAMA
jgi:hypothetical protein